jgi:hypothetical protein
MAMATTAVFNSRDLLLQPLPDLNISPRRTTSHALHRVHFVGVLQPWANFESDAMNTFSAQTWSLQHLDSRITGPSAAGSVDEEQVFVSNERGVQGRLEGRAGLVLGAAFRAQQLDLVPGDSRGALPPYRGYLRQPDLVMKTSSDVAKIVGEGKTHWIDEHDLDNAIWNFEAGLDERLFRHQLGQTYATMFDSRAHTYIGQIAEYRFDMRLKYGFMTTYSQTMFLRKVDVGRAWGLDYSPVILHSAVGSTAGQQVSVCQSFFHVGLLALANSDFGTSTGMRTQRWTERFS